MSFSGCLRRGFNCDNHIADYSKMVTERDELIARFKNHDSAAYGLSDLKTTGMKLDNSHIQRLWVSLGVGIDRQHSLNRAWYAPAYIDLWKFLSQATAHLTKSSVDYQCADYSSALFGERVALGLYGTCQIEWYLAVIGIISGQLETADGPVGHSWNWAIVKDNPNQILFIDYLKPKGEFHDINGMTKCYVYDPVLHGKPVNWTVTW